MISAIVGAVFVIIATLITRATTRDIANLQALHKVLDRESEILDSYAALVRKAVFATDIYLHWVESDTPKEKINGYLASVVEAESSLRYAGTTMPINPRWTDISLRHPMILAELHDVIIAKITKSDEQFREFLENRSEAIPSAPYLLVSCSFAHQLISAEYRDTAPDTLVDGIRNRFAAVFHPRR